MRQTAMDARPGRSARVPPNTRICRAPARRDPMRPRESPMAYVTEQNLTDIVLERWQEIPDPRLRAIMQSAIKHLHAFVREVEPTGQEWFTTIDWLTRTGKMSTDKRQEFILGSDILGVSMLVDAINH